MKERFEPRFEHCIEDNKTHNTFHCDDRITVCKILNEQDEKIKQLKKEIKQLKFDCVMYKSANYLINDIGIDKAREIMFQSEKKLKQSQNSKAIEVLIGVKEYLLKEANYSEEIGFAEYVNENYIDNQITELRGGENDNRRKK